MGRNCSSRSLTEARASKVAPAPKDMARIPVELVRREVPVKEASKAAKGRVVARVARICITRVGTMAPGQAMGFKVGCFGRFHEDLRIPWTARRHPGTGALFSNATLL